MPAKTESSTKTARRKEVEGAYPALSFHYGLSFVELAKMPRAIMRIYIDALPELIATQQLRLIEAISYPHLSEDSDRDAIVRRLRRHMGEDGPAVPTPQTMNEAKNLAMAAGISFTVVDKEGKEVTPDG